MVENTMRNIVIGTTKQWDLAAAVDLMFDLKPKYKVHVFQNEGFFNWMTPGLNPVWIFLVNSDWEIPKEISGKSQYMTFKIYSSDEETLQKVSKIIFKNMRELFN